MPIAKGVAKQLRYKVESTFGTAPGAAGAQLLRRVSSNLSMKKERYQSGEIISTQQIVDSRHGMRRVDGAIGGEISAGTYEDFFAAVLRRDFTAVTAISSLSITVAGSGPTFTATRAAGSWLTDGIKIGMVVRFTAGSLNAANLNKNLFVLGVTATVLTVRPLNDVAMVAEGPIASCTLTIPGKVSYVPNSGFTDKSFSIEHWHSDISRSHLFRGCKVNDASFQYRPGQMASVNFGILGQDVTRASSAYYTSPAAETAFGVMSPVNGLIYINGAAVTLISSLDFSLKGDMEPLPVIGANISPDIVPGRVMVDGQFTAHFDSATFTDLFDNESEVSLLYVLASGTAANADFMTYVMPRIKVFGADDADNEKALPITVPFQAFYNSAGGAGIATEQTTFFMQDSQA